MEQAEELAFGPSRDETFPSVGLLALAVGLSLVLAWFLSSQVTQSYQQVEAARGEAEQGREHAIFLSEASRHLAHTLVYEATLEEVSHLAVPVFADWCVVDLVAEGSTGLRRIAFAAADPARQELANTLRDRYPSNPSSNQGVVRVLQTGEPVLLTEVPETVLQAVARDAAHLQLLKEINPQSAMVVPLRGRAGFLGAMSFMAAKSGRRYGPEDLRLAQELADRAAMAVENARLFAQVQEAVRTRDEFLATASHDLKNPLTSVKVQAQLLSRRAGRSETLAPSDVLRAAEAIDTVATKAASQVDELLDVARLPLGTPLQLERHACDLVLLAREAVAEYGEASDRHHLLLETPEDAVVGQWDERRLRRVVDNLVSNAIKYSPDGGEVVVSLRKIINGKGPKAVLSVRDRGIGIPKDDLPRLFERFRRGSNVTGRIDGTGVGLASARHIVESHGGSIDIESEFGRGTEITVSLPLAPTA